MNFQNDDEKDLLELQLIESFRKLKIVNVPKFSPTKPLKALPTKDNMVNPIVENSNIFDKDGNIESDFYLHGLQPNKSPKGILDKIFQIATFPRENKEFDDERLNNEDENEEEDFCIYGDSSESDNENRHDDYDVDDFNDDDDDDYDDQKIDDDNDDKNFKDICGVIADDSDENNDANDEFNDVEKSNYDDEVTEESNSDPRQSEIRYDLNSYWFKLSNSY